MNHKMKKRAGRIGILCLGVILAFAGLTGCGRQEPEFYTEEELAEISEEGTQDEVAEKAVSQNVTSAGTEISVETAQPEIADSSENEGEAAAANVTAASEPTRIFVDVCGAVANPGVFELAAGSRVFQAIALAGGYLPEAAENYLNRASLLSDGQQIYVPTQAELEENPEKFGGETVENVSGTGMAGEAVSDQTTGTISGQDAETGADAALVNLNTADEAELTTLTGIGPSKAQAIIAYREANGSFAAVEDLMKVDGIKEGTFAKIKDKITVK